MRKLLDNIVFQNIPTAKDIFVNLIRKENIKELVDFENFNNPFKIIVSQNLQIKIEEILLDDKYIKALYSITNKIGIPQNVSYCVAMDDFVIFYQTTSTNEIIIGVMTFNFQEYFICRVLFKEGEWKIDFAKGTNGFFEILFNYQKFNLDTKESQLYVQSFVTVFIRTFLFLKFVEIKLVTVAPNQKYKPKKFEPVKNTLKSDIIVADVNWDTEIDMNLPFGVKGHYRMQRIGLNREMIKIIYINPFEKKGYHRKSGKDLNEGI